MLDLLAILSWFIAAVLGLHLHDESLLDSTMSTQILYIPCNASLTFAAGHRSCSL